MIRIIEDDIFNSPINTIICHQVNCQGVMGSGIAKEIKSRYPSVYEQYKSFCGSLDRKYLLGMGHLSIDNRTNRVIGNLFGQDGYGKGLQTDYFALQSALGDVKKFAKDHHLLVAIPFGIGRGFGGGDWNIVYKIIETVFEDYDNVVIYKLPDETRIS